MADITINSSDKCYFCGKEEGGWFTQVGENNTRRVCKECYKWLDGEIFNKVHTITLEEWTGRKDINDNELTCETSDVKACPHGFVFIKHCAICSYSPKWISVVDKLPECHVNILLTDKKNIGFGYLAKDNKECQEWKLNQFLEVVSHWMPLPEPPKC